MEIPEEGTYEDPDTWENTSSQVKFPAETDADGNHQLSADGEKKLLPRFVYFLRVNSNPLSVLSEVMQQPIVYTCRKDGDPANPEYYTYGISHRESTASDQNMQYAIYGYTDMHLALAAWLASYDKRDELKGKIITISLSLGFDNRGKGGPAHMMRIGTRKHKSILLAVVGFDCPIDIERFPDHAGIISLPLPPSVSFALSRINRSMMSMRDVRRDAESIPRCAIDPNRDTVMKLLEQHIINKEKMITEGDGMHPQGWEHPKGTKFQANKTNPERIAIEGLAWAHIHQEFVEKYVDKLWKTFPDQDGPSEKWRYAAFRSMFRFWTSPTISGWSYQNSDFDVGQRNKPTGYQLTDEEYVNPQEYLHP